MTVKEISETAGLSIGALQLVREDSTPATYLQSLEQQELYQDAIRFLAQKMAVDSGIKWAAAAVRELQAPERKAEKDDALDAVDQWVQAPGDATRWQAKETADKSRSTGPSHVVAMAVFLSGGSVSPPGGPETPPPPNAAQKMVAGSVIVAVVSHEPAKAKERYQRALAMGKTLDGG